MKEKISTVDSSEIEKFSKIAGEWWNPLGKFKSLHAINALRVEWIIEQVVSGKLQVASTPDSLATCNLQPATLKGLRLLDIGCGGGLICEPMATLGARVTGIDASEKNIAAAKLHAKQNGLEIDYRCITAEELVASDDRQVTSNKEKEPSSLTTHHSPLTTSYDIVLALEIIEHVANVEAFIAAGCALLKPGGIIIYSTLNRTAKSFALAIAGAEYILRWLPRGTHDWKKFVKPHELINALRRNNIEITEMTGMVMNPLTFEWRLDAKDLGVNYLVAGRKQSPQVRG